MIDETLVNQIKSELKARNNSWAADVQKRCGLSMLSVRETMNPNSRRFSKSAFQAAVQVLKEYRDEERKAEEQAKQIINR